MVLETEAKVQRRDSPSHRWVVRLGWPVTVALVAGAELASSLQGPGWWLQWQLAQHFPWGPSRSLTTHPVGTAPGGFILCRPVARHGRQATGLLLISL